MRDYLPRDQAELLNWAKAFASKLAVAPGDYGVSEQSAAVVSAAVDSYAQAFSVALAPVTRTKANVAGKNKARAAMLKLVRPVAQQIRANSAVADSLKIGLRIRLAGRAPAATGDLPALVERPFLHLAAVQPLRHVLGYSRGEANGRAKPFGAIGLQLFVHVGDAAPEDPLDARFLRFLSRYPYAVDFKPQQVGKSAFYFARWQTATGETGPWSQVLRMTVAG